MDKRNLGGREGEQGAVAVVMALSLVVLMGMAALAVDLGFLHRKRSDLQTAADISALAGASSILSYGTEVAPVRAVAVDYARRNLVEDDSPAQAVTDGDVAFYRDGLPVGEAPNQVEVTVRRGSDRGNGVDIFFGRAVGVSAVDVGATARAGIAPVCSSACVKPFLVPTKFTWNDLCEPEGSGYRANGGLDVASACEMASIDVLGYGDGDLGDVVTLKFGSPADTIVPSQYSPVDLPAVNKGTPVTGAAAYAENIAGCTGSNTVPLDVGDELLLEPGNMSGPTKAGVNNLLSQDPTAYWDSLDNAVKGSDWSDPMRSPRVAIVAFYDPRYPPSSGRNTLLVYQLGAVFIEGTGNDGSIQARFIRAKADSPTPSAGGGDNCFIFTTRLLLDSSRGAQAAAN